MDWHRRNNRLFCDYPVGNLCGHIREPQSCTLLGLGDSAYVPAGDRTGIIFVFRAQHQDKSSNIETDAA